ncbi:DMT family transporter [Streptomyces nogalater]
MNVARTERGPSLRSSLTASAGRGFDAIPPTALVLLGIVSVQVGSALAKHLFEAVGSFGTVALRLFFAAAVLMLLWRPSLRLPRRTWAVVLGYGVTLGLMNLCFYLALARIPLGIAVTTEFLGPLTVALAYSRRWLDALWALLAAGGVILLMEEAATSTSSVCCSPSPRSVLGSVHPGRRGAGPPHHGGQRAGAGDGRRGPGGRAVRRGRQRSGADAALDPGRGARCGPAVVGDPVLARPGSTAQNPPHVFGILMSLEPRWRHSSGWSSSRNRCTGRSGSRCCAWWPRRRAPPAAPAPPTPSPRRRTPACLASVNRPSGKERPPRTPAIPRGTARPRHGGTPSRPRAPAPGRRAGAARVCPPRTGCHRRR